MKSSILALLVALGSSDVFAATEAGAHHAEGIPTSVWLQFINFGLYVALLVFLLRKPVREYFKNRELAFNQALIKAEQIKKEAEVKRQEIQERLTQLESTSEQSIAKAKAEAEELKAKILREAEQLAQTMKSEAQRAAQYEVERAKNQLREELLSQAVEVSRKVLSDKMAEPDQKRLQTEFVDKIQVVRS